jgi:hypothetical protein
MQRENKQMLNLTTAEVKYAKKLLANVEKGDRAERWLRWLILPMGLWMIGQGIWLFELSRTVNPWPSGEPRLSSSQASQPVTQSKLEGAMSTLRREMMQSQTQIMGLADACVAGIMGFYFCLHSLVTWGNQRRNALIVKVLRAKLEEEVAHE